MPKPIPSLMAVVRMIPPTDTIASRVQPTTRPTALNRSLARMSRSGSSETTFYVLAVYFGSVGIRNTRHAVPVGLIADLAGMLAAVWVVNLLFR